jgi:Tfp pilus assembly protein PilF
MINLQTRWRRFPALAAAVRFAIVSVAAMPGVVQIAYAQGRGSQPLPLSGAAYRVAQQAYDSFSQRDYTASIAQAREAIRQRPDLIELRLLLANALVASGRSMEARRSLGDAMAKFGPDPALVTRRRQIEAVNTPARKARLRAAQKAVAATAAGTASDAGLHAFAADDGLSGPARVSAQKAYDAYAASDFASAVGFAQEAIALRPDLLRLRLLLIDAASAAGQDAVAWNASTDALQRFGRNETLRVRRVFIGNRLAPKAARDTLVLRREGDLGHAIEAARQIVAYAPDSVDYRLQLIDALLASNDLPGAEAAATDAIDFDDTEIMPFVLRGYARAAQGRSDAADADFEQALKQADATRRDQRVARVVIADVWLAQGRAQRALDILKPPTALGDDTDAPLWSRLFQATQQLAASGDSAAPAAGTLARQVGTNARPIVDCDADEFGASCSVYAADPGFTAAQESARAADSGNRQAALMFARDAVAAAPRDAQHRVDLINALAASGDEDGAAKAARAMVKDGALAALPPVTAAYVAQYAGDSQVAFEQFRRAEATGKLSAQATADAAFAAAQAHRNKEAAQYFERAIDASAEPSGDGQALTPQQLEDLRSGHADVTRNWGFEATLSYRGAGTQPGLGAAPLPGVSSNWLAGIEGYWRPFGSLGDRMFEVYARGYENFGVKNEGATGGQTLQAVIGARAKPFAQLDAVVAFEHIFPLGSAVGNDWLARLAYSGGFGTERRLDQPSWWTLQTYAETGYYLNNKSGYATGSLEWGRTYRIDRVSPRWTVFPYAVIGADYDSAVDHSIPVGAGFGISTRYWFRDGRYDALRSYFDTSLQYRWRITGDDRARGVFLDITYSY